MYTNICIDCQIITRSLGLDNIPKIKRKIIVIDEFR